MNEWSEQDPIHFCRVGIYNGGVEVAVHARDYLLIGCKWIGIPTELDHRYGEKIVLVLVLLHQGSLMLPQLNLPRLQEKRLNRRHRNQEPNRHLRSRGTLQQERTKTSEPGCVHVSPERTM